MNLDEVFGLTSTDIMVSTNPLLLFGCILSAILAGWLCVHVYRDTNDTAKSVKLYIPFAAAGALLFTVVGVPFLFSLGAQLCGLVALGLISNWYFNHSGR